MHKTGWLVLGIVALAFLLRMIYCWNLPVSGDESVSLLQAAGKAADYHNHIPTEPTSIQELKNLIEYEPGYGPSDVWESMANHGMHPPFYYWILHFAMRFFGNDPRVLRFVSVCFSILSVLCLYQIGKEIGTRQEGWLAALLMAASAYGIRHALMIRPYPLVMFLALLSTGLLLQLLKNPQKRILNRWSLAYFLTAVIGLYTLTHFIFVLVFHVALFLLKNLKNPKKCLLGAFLFVCIGLAFLPWLPSFLTQMNSIKVRSFYFYGSYHPLEFFILLAEQTFISHLAHRWTVVWFLLLPFFLIPFWVGVFTMARQKNTRNFLLALIIYILIYQGMDRLMGTQTLMVKKLLFFLVPVTIFIIVKGLWFLWSQSRLEAVLKSKTIKTSAAKTLYVIKSVLIKCFVLGTCLLFFTNTLYAYRDPIQALDGPSRVFAACNFAAQNQPPNQKALIILKHMNRRVLLSLAHGFTKDADLMTDQVDGSLELITILKQPDTLNPYDWIYIIFVGEEDPAEEIPQACEFLNSQNFYPVSEKLPPYSRGFVLIYQKNSDPSRETSVKQEETTNRF